MQDTLKKFIELWDGPKINMVITGGGISVIDALKIPGSSRVFGELHVPYSEESQVAILEDLKIENHSSESGRKSAFINSIKSVSKEMSKYFVDWQIQRNKLCDNNIFASVTASLSTIRKNKDTGEVSFRKGSNLAYVCIFNKNSPYPVKYTYYYITLNKINEEGMKGLCSTPGMIESLRENEDEIISKIVLYLLSGKEELKPSWFHEISISTIWDYK